MRIITVIGARPQFIKHAPTNAAIRAAGIEDVVIHTGQHYDREMSQLFFDELQIPAPDINLGVGSGGHAHQLALMMEKLEEAFLDLTPDLVLTHGDTNSTLAASLTAAKLGIPVAHNEAGMRSFNRSMPEEINRVLTDHCSSLLFCPTASAADFLKAEGIVNGVHIIGDVQYDAALSHRELAVKQSGILRSHDLQADHYILVTLHRPYTVDDPVRLKSLMETFGKIHEPILLPIHPRTQEKMRQFKIQTAWNVLITPPVGYLDMMALEASARLIMTDSGGVQKEAYYHGKPCLTLRPETEWRETVECGWNRVVDTNSEAILELTSRRWWPDTRPEIFGDGHAAEKLAGHVWEFIRGG